MVITDRGLAKRSAIVAAATRLFAEQGYRATRMADVAGAVGMQAGSLYYHVASKEALLAAVVEDRVGVAVDMLEGVIEQESDHIARVRRGVEGHLEVFDAHADLYRIFLSERLHVEAPDLAATVDRRGREYEHLWVQLLEEGIAAGHLRADLDPWLTMKAIVGLANSTLFWFAPGGRLTPAGVADRFTAIVLHGVVPPG